MPWHVRVVLFLALVGPFVMAAGCDHRPKPRNECQKCVEFEPPQSIGTTYGSPAGNTAGDVVFSENGIQVSVDSFKFSGGGGAFTVATIIMPPLPFGINQTIRTNNINLGFDFSGVGFPISEVQFEFLDLGGFENLSVNGSPVFAGELSSAPTSIGGTNLAVYRAPVSGGSKGIVIIRGAVKKIVVGGQEFWLDRVCARR
jgi:hypothetical protein